MQAANSLAFKYNQTLRFLSLCVIEEVFCARKSTEIELDSEFANKLTSASFIFDHYRR